MSKTYWQKLQDPRWQKRRLEILQAADFTCEACNDETSQLHVHHRYYLKGKDPWEYPDQALRCLCEVCHKTVGDQEAMLLAAIPSYAATEIGELAAVLERAGLFGFGLMPFIEVLKAHCDSMDSEIQLEMDRVSRLVEAKE